MSDRLTPELRYLQAVTKARLQAARDRRRFMAGETESSGTPTIDRERLALIREIGRAFDAGRADRRMD